MLYSFKKDANDRKHFIWKQTFTITKNITMIINTLKKLAIAHNKKEINATAKTSLNIANRSKNTNLTYYLCIITTMMTFNHS
jgi:hypothetical protein